jgi:hypothetical protein
MCFDCMLLEQLIVHTLLVIVFRLVFHILYMHLDLDEAPRFVIL